MNINATLSRVDAANIAHDHGAGEEAIITAIEGEDPDVARMVDEDLRLGGAVLEMCRKLIAPESAMMTAQRFIALCLHVAPDVLGLSQSAAAKQMKISRASLSKHSIALAEAWGLGHARWRKKSHMPGTYRAAQLRAVAKGTHAAFKRKDLKKLKKINGTPCRLTRPKGNETHLRKTLGQHARPPIQRAGISKHDCEMAL